MTGALGALGSAVLAMLASIGRVVIFAANTVKHLALPPFYPREFFQALVQIGWLSLPVVVVLRRRVRGFFEASVLGA